MRDASHSCSLPGRRGEERMLGAPGHTSAEPRAKGNRASEGFVVGGGGGLSPAASRCAEADSAMN
jgi:hypothetical protein